MSLLREICGRHEDAATPDELTELVIVDLALNARQREALYPLIRNACWNMDRSETRKLEAEALPLRSGRPVDESAKSTLLNTSFITDDGERVPWGEATITQHESRIAMLERMVHGLCTTIGRHRKAIAALRETGATCLNDIPDFPWED